MSSEDARAAFAEQAQALARGGADLMWIETMSSVEETEAAIAGARTTGLPVVATLSFDTNGRTMMGITPSDLAGLHRKHHLAACGSNCGVSPSELVASIVNLAAASDSPAVLVAKSNCGIPQYVDGAIRFNGTPELMAVYAGLALDAGARIIGGCCGTTPEHLRRHARGAGGARAGTEARPRDHRGEARCDLHRSGRAVARRVGSSRRRRGRRRGASHPESPRLARARTLTSR